MGILGIDFLFQVGSFLVLVQIEFSIVKFVNYLREV